LKSTHLEHDIGKNMEEISALGNVVKLATYLIPYVVDFTDSRLKTSYEDNFNELQTLSDEQRQVHALIEVHDLAQVLDGPDSAGVHEALWHLLLPRLRPELRQWHRHSGSDKRASTVLLRIYLSNFLREELPMEFAAEAQKPPWSSVGLSEATQNAGVGDFPDRQAEEIVG
jgi:hypothetical protein